MPTEIGLLLLPHLDLDQLLAPTSMLVLLSFPQRRLCVNVQVIQCEKSWTSSRDLSISWKVSGARSYLLS